MPKLTNKKKLNEWSELYLGNINACLSNFLMWEICWQDQRWVLTLLLKAKKIKLPQMNSLLEKQLRKFSYTYYPLSFCKILKKILEAIQSYEDVSFLGPSVLNKMFLVKTIIITFIHLPFGPFHWHCAEFKKNRTVDLELWGWKFLDPKRSICPNLFLEN